MILVYLKMSSLLEIKDANEILRETDEVILQYQKNKISKAVSKLSYDRPYIYVRLERPLYKSLFDELVKKNYQVEYFFGNRDVTLTIKLPFDHQQSNYYYFRGC